jgi:hypothetical protein
VVVNYWQVRINRSIFIVISLFIAKEV